MYALGVMAFVMLHGDRPFPGPEVDDLREQHIEQAAPPLEDVSANLAGVVADCLMKPPGARPRPADVLSRLEGDAAPGSGVAGRLQQVNLKAVQQAAEKAATAEAKRHASERRQDLYEAAQAALPARPRRSAGAAFRERP